MRSLPTARALRVVALSCALSALGCFDAESIDPGRPSRASTPVDPDATGWVAPGSNPLGITGFWYSYGDQYDEPKRCTVYGEHPADVGQHDESQCSFVAWPDALPALEFANIGGKLCTYGNAAKVNPCVSKSKCQEGQTLDYSNMWGAGIGLDFGLEIDGTDPMRVRDPSPGTRKPWDASAHGVVGVAFDFEWTDATVKAEPYLRVEFPMLLPDSALTISMYTVGRDGVPITAGKMLASGSSSEDHPSGSPFVDAPPEWTGHDVTKHLVVGHNEFLWSQVSVPPDSNGYAFDPTQLLGMLLQVPPLTDMRLPYGFCIEHLAFLRE